MTSAVRWVGTRSPRSGVTLIDRLSPIDAADSLERVAAGGIASYRQADVTDREQIDAVLAAIDPLDIAIGNAGIVDSAPFLEVTSGQWEAQLDINLTGCFNVGQSAARLMVERKRPGRIIFTGSWVGDIPGPTSRPTRCRRRACACSPARWRGSSRRRVSA